MINTMQIECVIATYCRHEELAECLTHIEKSTLTPYRVIIIDATPASQIKNAFKYKGELNVYYYHTEKPGLASQRNEGMLFLDDNTEIITFLDDDMYVDPTYFENLEKAFAEKPDLVGAEGSLRIDGKNIYKLPQNDSELESLYGCNMSFRVSVIGDIRFDEVLTRYSYMEDWDFSYQVGRKGKMLKLAKCTGCHMQSPAGRVNHKKMGYMAVGNHCYLHRKNNIFSYKDIVFYLAYISKKAVFSYKKSERERLKGACFAFWRVVILKERPIHKI